MERQSNIIEDPAHHHMIGTPDTMPSHVLKNASNINEITADERTESNEWTLAKRKSAEAKMEQIHIPIIVVSNHHNAIDRNDSERIKRISESGRKHPFAYSPFLAKKFPALESVEDQRSILDTTIFVSLLATFFALRRGKLLLKCIEEPIPERFRAAGLHKSNWNTYFARSKYNTICNNFYIGGGATLFWGITGTMKWMESWNLRVPKLPSFDHESSTLR